MELIYFIFLILVAAFFLLLLLVVIDFIVFLAQGKGGRLPIARSPLTSYIVIGMTNLVFLILIPTMENVNDRHHSWILFAPAHLPSIYVLMASGTVAYFYCLHRERLAPPVVEVPVNCLLMIQIVLYVVISIEADTGPLGFFCPLPATLQFIILLVKNHQQAVKNQETQPDVDQRILSAHPVMQFCWFILRQAWWKKFPVLVALCLPFLAAAVPIHAVDLFCIPSKI